MNFLQIVIFASVVPSRMLWLPKRCVSPARFSVSLTSAFLLLVMNGIVGADVARPIGFPQVHLRLIMMVSGSRNQRLGYEVMGSAYDVAVNRSVQRYPEAFRNLAVTRYFVPGNFSCADADAETTVGLSKLYTTDTLLTGDTVQGDQEFRVVLSPGCSFETVTLGDFAREEDVPVLASTASLDILNNKRRFPTLLPLASTSYNNVGSALLAVMRRYGWKKFNLVCDSNPKDPQKLAMEVSCGVLRQTFRAVTDVIAITVSFDSSKDASIMPMLVQCKKQSAVTVIASLPVVYDRILRTGLTLGMASGDFVFYLLPLTAFIQFEEHHTLTLEMPTNLTTNLTDMLPFAFTLAFDAINWDAMSPEVEEMVQESSASYSWPIPVDLRHNVLQLAAYESVLMLAEVLKDNFNQLSNMTGSQFTAKFFNRTFNLPSRRVTLNAVGTRECDVFINQFNNQTGHFQTVFKLDSKSKLLVELNETEIIWFGVSFPPKVVPRCGFDNNGCTNTGDSTLLIICVTVAAIAILCMGCTGWWYISSRDGHDRWWLLEQDRMRTYDAALKSHQWRTEESLLPLTQSNLQATLMLNTPLLWTSVQAPYINN